MTTTQITKAEALRRLQTASAITMVAYEAKNYGTGEFVAHGVRPDGVVGKRRVVTGTRSRGVVIGGSTLDLNESHEVHLDEDGNLVVTGIDDNGEPWVRMTYLIEN